MSKFVRVKIAKSLRDVSLVVQTARIADTLLFERSQSINTIIGFYVKPVNFPPIVVALSILIFPALFSSVSSASSNSSMVPSDFFTIYCDTGKEENESG